MFSSLFLTASLLLGVPGASTADRVRRVEIEGNVRIPALTIVREVTSKPETVFDPARLQADVKTLHRMGYFERIEAESKPDGQGHVDVLFRVREYPFVYGFLIEGADDKLQSQIQDYLRQRKLELRPATPYRPSRGNEVAVAVREYLRARKYPNAEVGISARGEGNSVRVVLSIRSGAKVEVGRVVFSGNHSIDQHELVKQIENTRPAGLIGRLKGEGRYVPLELTADMERVRRYYQSRGYAAASIGEPDLNAFNTRRGWPVKLPGLGEKIQLEVRIPVTEGPRYRLVSVRLEGNSISAAAEFDQLMGTLRAPCDYDASVLDNARQKMIDLLGHRGYALAEVRLEESRDDNRREVRAVYRVDPGDPVLVGRIKFEGNSRIPDKFLRRRLRVLEGDVYDSAKLDQSVDSLNKSELLQPVRRADVTLAADEERNAVDITFKIKERDRQGIYGTGGTGGIGGGYLGILYTAFNVLGLGEMLSFELDGGAAQSNILLNIAGTHFLGSYFSVGLSAFHRLTTFNVASIVPGPDDLVRVLRRRSTGVGLSGAYPITRKLSVGLGYNIARDRIDGELQPGEAPASSFIRSDVTPFFALDSTRGVGPAMRGYRLGGGFGWSGSALLRSLDSTNQSIRFSQYVGDPLAKGRNSFAFLLQAGTVQTRPGTPFLLERRLYPGEEIARGFSRGGLTPWAYVPGTSTPTLLPSGADTMLGVSVEYRVPIHGALSGAGFADFGWTHINPTSGAQFYPGARVIDATNNLLRASIGGELRVQLPMIRQPARLIFSWNPLRLDTWLRGYPSPVRLVDLRTSFRFALGNIF